MKQKRVFGFKWRYVAVLAMFAGSVLTEHMAFAAISSVTSWGSSGASNGQFSSPTGIAVASNGDVYIGENGNHRIQVFSSTGTFKSIFNSTDVSEPQGMAFDGSGNLWVADALTNNIKKFNSGGTLLATYGSSGTGNGQFNTPSDLAVDSNGNVFVADYSNSRIEKFDSVGNYVTQWGSNGAGNGQFNNPIGVAVDASGNVYVSEDSNCRIQKFTNSGSFVATWGSAGSSNGQLLIPQKLAVDTSGDVYVADAYNARLVKFNTSGTYLDTYGGPFNSIYGVAVNNSGSVYTVEYGGNQVQKLNDSLVAPANSAPNAPSALGPNALVSSGIISSAQPAFTFTLSDPNASDTVKYELQIDDTFNFSSLVVDYTSSLGAQGSAGFTVGQAAGSGVYAAGSAGQQLSDGWYYWRIKAIDNSGAASPYVMAHGNAIAFTVDTSAPSVPGVPSATTSPTVAQPSLSWAPASDSGAGLATVPYIVEWSQDPAFTTSVSSAAANSTTFTVPAALSPGVWYFRVKAADATGKFSAYSNAGSVTIQASSAHGVARATSGESASDSSVPSSSSSAPATNNGALLNDFSAFSEGVGQTITLATGQLVHFAIGGELHTATLKQIAGDYVVVTLASTPRDVTLNTGQTESYDVTGDGKNDVTITLTGIYDGVAQFTFAAYHANADVSGSSATPTSSTPASNGNSAWPGGLVWILGIGGVLIGGVIVGWLYIKRRHNS